MKVARLETLFCDAGWRPWIFVKATAADGLVGWAEVTDSHGSPHGLAGIVEDLAVKQELFRDLSRFDAILADGATGLRVNNLTFRLQPHRQLGSRGGHRQLRAHLRNACFTSRSSRE